MDFCQKIMSLLFNNLFRLVITFLPRSKHLLISRLQSPSAVTLECKIIKSVTVSPCICHEVMGPDAMILVFWMLSFKATFSLSSFTFIKKLFNLSSLSAISMVSCEYLRFLIWTSLTVWMWVLDYKESWKLKNWSFWTVVLEKTLEIPLDSKEI